MASPEVLIDPQKVWSDNYTSTLIKFTLITITFIITLVVLFTVGNLQEIGKNFPRYRCHPLAMPFAGFFGYDARENFGFCLSNIFNVKVSQIFGPIYKVLVGFTDIIRLIVDAALGLRKLFSNFLLSVNGFISSVRDRVQMLLFQIRLSFIKLHNLMGRVYGTMYAIIWMGTSALTAGMNIADNDLVKFMFEFCFDPETPVKLADGSYVPIRAVKIGTKLAPILGNPNPVVISKFHFDGSQTPMVRIKEIQVSANHYVKDEYSGQMIKAENHQNAFHISSLPELICLNVTGNRFGVGYGKPLIVADYDEHSSTETNIEAQTIAMKALNGTSQTCTANNYDLGIDGSFEVRMADDSWKRADEINIHDNVWNAGTVLGIVHEECAYCVPVGTQKISASQTIFNPESNKWMRGGGGGGDVDKESCGSGILYSFITATTGTIEIRDVDKTSYFIRDYREVPLTDMQAPYTRAVEVC